MMGDVVTVDLTNHDPNTPLGMLLAPALAPTTSSSSSKPSGSNVTILAGWEHLPNGNKLGPIQRSGLVRLGDRLVHINNVDVTHMVFRDVMDLLKNMLYGSDETPAARVGYSSSSSGGGGGGIRLRSMGFAPIGRKDVMAASSSTLGTKKDGTQRGIDMSAGTLPSPQNQRLYTFRSSIRRARVRVEKEDATQNDVDGNGSDGHISASFLSPQEHEIARKNSKDENDANTDGEAFVEYEICCHLVIHFRGGGASYRIGGKGEQQTWNVWKRYSEFKTLDEKLRKSYGWHFDSSNNGRGLLFPPSHVLSSLFGGSLNPSFVENRRAELEEYWQSLHRIDAIFDFSNPSSHRFSRDLASFISLENHLFRNKPNAVSNHNSWASGQSIPGNGATHPTQSTSHASLGTSEEHDDSSSLSCSLPPSGADHDGIAGFKDDDSHPSLSLHGGMDASGSCVTMPSAGSHQRSSKSRRKNRASRAAKPAFQRQFL
mmetsp:Transcript_947/g.1311  ORF Transcript_947/g.1311 Transcript_947/m.1311 type:complete len:486 (-) Transcript_947:217-1674(-)